MTDLFGIDLQKYENYYLQTLDRALQDDYELYRLPTLNAILKQCSQLGRRLTASKT